MPPNHQAFDSVEVEWKGAVAEQSEEALVEEQHGIEGIDHADGALADGMHQRMVRAVLCQQLQRDHALVDQVNGEVARGQAAVGTLLQLVRVKDAYVVPLAAEVVLAQLELAVGAHPAPVHDGNTRLTQAAPGAVASQQFSQDARAGDKGFNLVVLREVVVERQVAEDGAERFAKGQAAGAFGVVFDEVERGVLAGFWQRICQIKGIQAAAVVAGAARGLQREQRVFLTADAQARAQSIVRQQIIVGLAQRAAHDARYLHQVAVGSRREEVRPQHRADRSCAEIEPIGRHRGLHLFPCSQGVGRQQLVPTVNGCLHGHVFLLIQPGRSGCSPTVSPPNR